MILILGLLNRISSQSTDCNQVQAEWFEETCNEDRTCSDGYACQITENNCATYGCKQDGFCDAGTFFRSFSYTNDHENADDQSGFACYPPEMIPNGIVECFFDPANSYKLSVNAKMPSIERENVFDDRQITLIDYDTFLAEVASAEGSGCSQPAYEFFNTSQCVGVENTEEGATYFNSVSDGPNGCSFTDLGFNEADSSYSQKFVIGYDDNIRSGGSCPGIRKYGKSRTVTCSIKAWDTQWQNPAAGGGRDDEEIEIETEVEFTMKMYRDIDFTNAYNGEPIDINPDSPESRRVYFETTAVMPTSEVKMVHLKHCRAQEVIFNETSEEFDIVDYFFDFIVNGYTCSGSNCVDFGMNSSRIEWNDEDSKTYVKDQFFVDIWEPIAQTGQTIKLDITCEMVVCPVAAFAREDDEYSSESICWLNTAAQYVDSTRYSNLYPTNNVRASRSLKNDEGKFKYSQFETADFSMEFTIKAEPTTNPLQPGTTTTTTNTILIASLASVASVCVLGMVGMYIHRK